jgi:hypothetical protein
MGLSIFDESVPVINYVEVNNAAGTSYVNVNTTYPFPLRIDSLICSNDDSVDHYVQVAASNGSFDASYGTVHVPAGAGRTNVPAVDAVAILAPTTLQGFILPAFFQLAVRTDVAVNSPNVLYFTAVGGFV